MTLQHFDQHQEETLRTLCLQLDNELRPYYQIHGFVFAIASSPEIPTPNEWMACVFQHSSSLSEEQAEQLVSCLMSLFHFYANQQREGEISLPPACTFKGADESNDELSDWCNGMLLGHTFVEPTWNKAWGGASEQYKDVAESSMEEDLVGLLSLIATFADIPLALEDAEKDSRSQLRDNLQDAYETLPQALAMYVALADSLVDFLPDQMETFVRSDKKIGRNDPCHCGSGKKYKKCCAMH
nr:UPF0149 family protein [Flocculibacter collagenilyticus]